MYEVVAFVYAQSPLLSLPRPSLVRSSPLPNQSPPPLSLSFQWRYYGRAEGGVHPPPPSPNCQGWRAPGQSASYVGTVRRPKDGYKDILCNSIDREKSTDSIQGTTAQESIDSVEGEESTVPVEPTTMHSVPSSSGHSGSTLSGTFSNNLRPPPLPQPSTAVHAKSPSLSFLAIHSPLSPDFSHFLDFLSPLSFSLSLHFNFLSFSPWFFAHT